MLRRILPAALIACTMVVACTDSTGPEASRIGVERVAPQFGVEESGIHILYHSASALPLETYEAAVWACRDKSRSLVILYQQGDGAEDKEGRDEDEEGRDEDAGCSLAEWYAEHRWIYLCYPRWDHHCVYPSPISQSSYQF